MVGPLPQSMPAKKATRKVAATKTAKQQHIGSARREAKAAAKPNNAGRRAARGVAHDKETGRLDPTIHAKKDTRSARGANGKVTVGTPNVAGYTGQVDAEKYNAMKDIILKVMPRKAPGMTQGEMFDAVRAAASHNHFPGSTHRWWAKSVQLDLETKGALVRETTAPLRWHLR